MDVARLEHVTAAGWQSPKLKLLTDHAVRVFWIVTRAIPKRDVDALADLDALPTPAIHYKGARSKKGDELFKTSLLCNGM